MTKLIDRDLVSLCLECVVRSGNWGLPDWRKDSNSEADRLSGKSAESAVFVGGRGVCVHEGEEE